MTGCRQFLLPGKIVSTPAWSLEWISFACLLSLLFYHFKRFEAFQVKLFAFYTNFSAFLTMFYYYMHVNCLKFCFSFISFIDILFNCWKFFIDISFVLIIFLLLSD